MKTNEEKLSTSEYLSVLTFGAKTKESHVLVLEDESFTKAKRNMEYIVQEYARKNGIFLKIDKQTTMMSKEDFCRYALDSSMRMLEIAGMKECVYKQSLRYAMDCSGLVDIEELNEEGEEISDKKPFDFFLVQIIIQRDGIGTEPSPHLGFFGQNMDEIRRIIKEMTESIFGEDKESNITKIQYTLETLEKFLEVGRTNMKEIVNGCITQTQK